MVEYTELMQPIENELEDVSKEIKKQLKSEVVLVNQVANYIIDSGGKRLRPALVLLMSKVICQDNKILEKHYLHLVKMACVIEFIHTATLLHDDVVDESGLRRSKETAFSLFGSAPSVLVGDFLYSRAFQIMVDVNNKKIMEIMANATNTIAEGEVLQLMNCNDPDIDENRYLKVIRYKTAKLFQASCEIPAALSNLEEKIICAAGSFGMHLGTAFQLTDDVLDYVGTESEIGKKLGDDLREGKPTLPLIRVVSTSDHHTKEKIKNTIKSPSEADLEKIVLLIKRSDAIEYTKKLALKECFLAKNCLENFKSSIHKKILIDLLDFVMERRT